jgi:hypothetical protein
MNLRMGSLLWLARWADVARTIAGRGSFYVSKVTQAAGAGACPDFAIEYTL